MKTITAFLFMLFCTSTLEAQSFMFSAENNYRSSDGSCPGYNTGILTYGENINSDAHLQDHYLTFSSPAVLPTMNPCPSWVGFMLNDVNGCFFIKRDGGVDMSGYGMARFAFTAKASVSGSTLKVYLGSAPDNSDFPSSSTWNTGAGDVFDVEFTLSDAEQFYTIDFEAFDATQWGNWTESNNVNVFGFAPTSAGIEYQIGYAMLGPLPTRMVPGSAQRTMAGSNSCGTAANVPLSVTTSEDQSILVSTEQGGHIIIDPLFMTDKVVVTDVVGRTEEFTGNDFHTQLRGMLVVTCVSGNRVKKAKVVLN